MWTRVSDDAFYNHTRIEKCLLFAQQFGPDLHCDFEQCLGGLSSHSFTIVSQNIAKNRSELYDPVVPHVPESFREDGFLSLVEKKSDEWLYVASIVHMLAQAHRERDDLVGRASLTSWRWGEDGMESYPEDYVAGVLEDLESAGTVRTLQVRRTGS